MLRRGFIGVWRWLLKIKRALTIAIILICFLEWLLVIVCWRRLLPRGLIKSLWLLPSLVVPSLMHVLIVISSSCNMIITKLIAKGVRVHSSKRK
ncbi:hypothetical protein AHAS_Ahas07G0127000 [Arachis hypogaea]